MSKKVYEVSEVVDFYKNHLKCSDCEFCFPDDTEGYVCAGNHYGIKISENDKNNAICDGVNISLDTYIELKKSYIKTNYPNNLEEYYFKVL